MFRNLNRQSLHLEVSIENVCSYRHFSRSNCTDLSSHHNSSLDEGSVHSHHSKFLESNTEIIKEDSLLSNCFVHYISSSCKCVPCSSFNLELNISLFQLLKSHSLTLLRERMCNGGLNYKVEWNNINFSNVPHISEERISNSKKKQTIDTCSSNSSSVQTELHGQTNCGWQDTTYFSCKQGFGILQGNSFLQSFKCPLQELT